MVSANSTPAASTVAPGRVPQDAGWDDRVPLDYDALKATGKDIDALQDRGVLDRTWASNAAKYEWQDDFGDVGPAVPQLEDQLFKDDNKLTIGDYIRTLTEFSVSIEGPTDIAPVSKFEDAGLHPITLQNVQKSNYLFPTPIQAYTIPAVLSGRDVLGIAQTGSGKTAAYMVPILSKLMGKAKKLAAPRPNPVTYNDRVDAVQAQPLVLIIVPIRELALQVFDEARRMCYRTMLRPCVAYGGGPRSMQLQDLRKGCDILIGTPGRLKDLVCNEGRWLSLRRLKYTVIDEADEMVQDDWEDELSPILSGGAAQNNADHIYLMFSATFPKGSRAMARKYLAEDHVRIRVGRIGSAHANVHQLAVYATDENKNRCMADLLMSLPPCRTLIFCNTVRTVDAVDDFLYNKNFPVASIHSGRTQREREDAIRAFRSGTCPILVASGVSARGLDIKNVMHVINYDLPSVDHGGIDEYVHRIGRTGRIGNRGQATSLFNDKNADIAEALVKIFMECKHELPDFLQEYMPADGQVTWDDDSDEEGEGPSDVAPISEGAGGGWGASDTVTGDEGAGNGGWGGDASVNTTGGSW